MQRAKLILYAAEGLGDAEIARRLVTAAEVVGRWWKRVFEERLAGLGDRKRRGRPRRFPPGGGRPGEGDRRWLAEHAIEPWRYRSWIFPTDPNFLAKAGRVLDLYQGRWQGALLTPATS